MRLYRLSSLFMLALFAGPWWLWHEAGWPGWLVIIGSVIALYLLLWLIGTLMGVK